MLDRYTQKSVDAILYRNIYLYVRKKTDKWKYLQNYKRAFESYPILMKRQGFS